MLYSFSSLWELCLGETLARVSIVVLSAVPFEIDRFQFSNLFNESSSSTIQMIVEFVRCILAEMVFRLSCTRLRTKMLGTGVTSSQHIPAIFVVLVTTFTPFHNNCQFFQPVVRTWNVVYRYCIPCLVPQKKGSIYLSTSTYIICSSRTCSSKDVIFAAGHEFCSICSLQSGGVTSSEGI